MDNELSELCKEVYEKTGWHIGGQDERWDYPHQMDKNERFISPLYTSDYLLDKLPNYIHVEKCVELKPSTRWMAYHSRYSTDHHREYSSSPLKALLKLTVALHEAGELKETL